MRIELQGVTKRFGPVKALQCITLAAADGDLLVLEGPNGSGKSTLLRVLSTALVPDQGLYLCDGNPTKVQTAGLRARLAFLDHSGGLYEDLTVEENLAFWARVYGKAQTPDWPQRLEAALKQWQLDMLRMRHVRTLSQGMRRRVGLAKTALLDPSMILLDEPFNGLDSHNAGTLLAMLKQWKETGKIVAIATHQPQILSNIATQSLPLDCGQRTNSRNSRDTSLNPNSPNSRGIMNPGPPDRTRQGARHPLTLLRKDILLEWKARELIGFLGVFSLSIILLFSFAWDVTARQWPDLAPGVLWVTFLFAGVLSFQRGFAIEKENHCLDALLISPLPASSLFLAKTLASLLWLMLLGAVVYPVFFLLHDLSFWHHLGKIMLVHAVGNAGLVSLGVLLSGVSSHARAREALLPILLFPLAVPLFICAIEATGSILRDGVLGSWFSTLCAVSVILSVLSWLLCDWVWEER